MPLDGDWYNELRSHMRVSCQRGKISGYYEAAVGSTSGKYDLVGAYDQTASDDASLAFCVSWINGQRDTPATTAWCGHYQENLAGDESIVTMWLLTASTKPGEDWKSTLVGQNTFRRTQPSNDEHALRMAARPASHPGVQRFVSS
jgi:hypothetical protein